MNLAFNILTYSESDSAFPKPEVDNYNYWTLLLERYLPKANMIEIQCWNEEREIIKEILFSYKDKFDLLKEDNITIFRGKKTAELSEYLLNNYMNKMGEFKWFTVNLNHGERSVLHSSHWGTEFHVPNIREKDIEFIKRITPPKTNFHNY